VLRCLSSQISFEGNFSNLGNDITHAPSSLANHPDELAETIGGALAIAAPFAIPELGSALGAGLGLGAGELGAGAADLGAANAAFGAFDEGAFAAGAADAGLGLGGAEFAGLAPELANFGALDSAFGAFNPELGGAEFTGGGGDFVAAGGDFAGGGGDFGAGGADLSAGPDAGPAAAPSGPGAAPTGTGATPSYVNLSVASAPPSAELGLANLNSEFGAFTPGAAAETGGGIVNNLGGWGNIAKWSLAGAPLALTLAMGQGGLPSSAQALQAQANQLSATGQQDLAAARAGTLNAGQTATLGQMRQDLTNQWRQTLYNQGVTDITKDARWPQIEAQIDAQVTQQTATLIQQNITNALAETGQASTALTAIAQMQLQQDQNFTNQLIGATKSLGLAAALSGPGAPKVQQVINA
jgi:hypothetical protein